MNHGSPCQVIARGLERGALEGVRYRWVVDVAEVVMVRTSAKGQKWEERT